MISELHFKTLENANREVSVPRSDDRVAVQVISMLGKETVIVEPIKGGRDWHSELRLSRI